VFGYYLDPATPKSQTQPCAHRFDDHRNWFRNWHVDDFTVRLADVAKYRTLLNMLLLGQIAVLWPAMPKRQWESSDVTKILG
jgi:hypothetical protein